VTYIPPVLINAPVI